MHGPSLARWERVATISAASGMTTISRDYSSPVLRAPASGRTSGPWPVCVQVMCCQGLYPSLLKGIRGSNDGRLPGMSYQAQGTRRTVQGPFHTLAMCDESNSFLHARRAENLPNIFCSPDSE